MYASVGVVQLASGEGRGWTKVGRVAGCGLVSCVLVHLHIYLKMSLSRDKPCSQLAIVTTVYGWRETEGCCNDQSHACRYILLIAW